MEEILERIKAAKGVEGYVICDQSGTCVRQGSPTGSMPSDLATRYGNAMQTLAQKARHVIRDLEPSHELDYLRIRCTKHELMVAYDKDFLVIVIQKW